MEKANVKWVAYSLGILSERRLFRITRRAESILPAEV